MDKTSILIRCDQNLVGVLTYLTNNNFDDVLYFKRSYLAPLLIGMLCRNLGLDNIDFTRIIGYWAVVETVRAKQKCTYPAAVFSVYYTLHDEKVPEKIIPIFNESLRYFIFGDLLFESIIPQELKAKAEREMFVAKAHLLQHGTLPLTVEQPLTEKLDLIISRLNDRSL